jgi:hypothetical protein
MTSANRTHTSLESTEIHCSYRVLNWIILEFSSRSTYNNITGAQQREPSEGVLARQMLVPLLSKKQVTRHKLKVLLITTAVESPKKLGIT